MSKKMDEGLKSYWKMMHPLPTDTAPGGQIREPLKAILFDIYGTLFVSGSGDVGVAEELATERFRQSNALEAWRAHYRISWSVEQTTRKLWAAIRQEHARLKATGVDYPEVKIDRIWQGILGWSDLDRVRRLAQAYECIVNPTYPMPGLDHVLRTLRSRGLRMGIVSNAQFFTPYLFQTFLGATTETLGFARELTLYSYRFGWAKPSRRLFDLAVQRLKKHNIGPESVLYVGNDMRNDIRPAGEVGLQTALFAGDRRSLRQRTDDPTLQGHAPDLVITELRQLLGLDWSRPFPSA